ncbi:MAG: hypothetical protein DMF95_19100 [Acidobacteria bacterium]|nr:MAG: hypothetical protein DMF95_19100 [Acidobacteriota bacterium]
MRHFLAPLVDAPAGTYALRNERTGVTISTTLMPAFDSRARRRGLLGRHALERHTALVLAPCQAIHTWFMRFAIDVLFVRKDGTVLEVLPGVRPWRIALSLRAFAVIELAAGVAAASETRAGDRLEVVAREEVGP